MRWSFPWDHHHHLKRSELLPVLPLPTTGETHDEVPRIASANYDFSCVEVTSKFIVLGTCYGTLHVMDHQGNEAASFSPHCGRISQISVDDSCEYVGTCADDNTVAIVDLFEGKVRKFQVQLPVETIALNPRFSHHRSFVTGGLHGDVTMVNVGRPTFWSWLVEGDKTVVNVGRSTLWSWLNPRNESLHKGNGSTILDIKWKNDLLAWVCYEAGLRVWDTCCRKFIPIAECKKQQRSCCSRARLLWQDDSTLMCSWGNCVKILALREIGAVEESQIAKFAPEELEEYHLGRRPVAGTRYVEVVTTITTEFIVRGVASYGEEIMILLECEKRGQDCHCKLTFMSWRKDVLGTLAFVDYERRKPAEYWLASSKDARYYVVSPKEVLAPEVPVRDENRRCLRSSNIFDVLLNALASSEDPKDHARLRKNLRNWPTDLYSGPLIASNIEFQLRTRPERPQSLLQALKQIYVSLERYEDAVDVYLEIGEMSVFRFIADNVLEGCLSGKIAALAEIGGRETVELLIQARNVVPAAQVVAELRERNRRPLESYLWTLFLYQRELTTEFHTLQAELLADFRPHCLMEFLRTSRNYDFRQAYQVCTTRKNLPAMVYVLAADGQHQDAVGVILKNHKRLHELLDVVSEFEGVWKVLVTRAKSDRSIGEALQRHPVGKIYFERASDEEKIKVLQSCKNILSMNRTSSSSSSCSSGGSRDDLGKTSSSSGGGGASAHAVDLMDDSWFYR